VERSGIHPTFKEHAQNGRSIKRPAERASEFLSPWRRAAAPFALKWEVFDVAGHQIYGFCSLGAFEKYVVIRIGT
jgi:hypothetical protein